MPALAIHECAHARPFTRSRRDAEVRSHFACDPASHQICVVDAAGGLVEVFGEAGSLPGQFHRPSDVLVVTPRFDGEDAAGDHLGLVVVADRGNHRLQVFEPQGQLVGIIGEETGAGDAAAGAGGRDGWPFFRTHPHPAVHDPVCLRWDDPELVVIHADGGETRIDLAAALLPTFDEWLAGATLPMLWAAHHHFRHKTRRPAVAGAVAAIETALGSACLESGDLEAVTRLWSLTWPAGLAGATRDRELAARDRAAMRAAFKLGGARPVARVRAALRLSLGAFASWPAMPDGDHETREAS